MSSELPRPAAKRPWLEVRLHGWANPYGVFFYIIKNTKKLRTPDSPWPFATIGYWLLESTTPAGLSSALLYRKGHWGVVPVCSKNAMLSITHCTPAASAHRARRATGSLKVSPRGRREASVATAPPTRSLQGKVHAFEYTNQTIRPHNNLELCGDPAAALKTSQTLEQGRTQSPSPPGAHKLGGRVARCGWLVY